MPSWRFQALRPLRPLLANNPYVCRPCRLRLFATITRQPFRHSTPLLHDKSDNDHASQPTKSEDAVKQGGADDPRDLWPSNKNDLKKPEDSKPLSRSEDKDDDGARKSRPDSGPEPSTQDTDHTLPQGSSPVVEQSQPSLAQHSKTSHATSSDAKAEFRSLVAKKDDDTSPDSDSSSFVTSFFKSILPTPSENDGGALQSLKEAMLSFKNDPSSIDRRKKAKATRLRTRRRRPRSFANNPAPETPERVAKMSQRKERDTKRALKALEDVDDNLKYMKASDQDLQRLQIEQPPVPRLAHGLDRVLFNQGVYQLQDPRSKVYNFDPYLQKIMPVAEFDYDALTAYKTSSQDHVLSGIAKEHGKKYVGSTSSMTSTLTHFHYLLSAWRKINISMISKDFPDTLQSFTALNRAPTSVFLRRKGDTYAVDADKEYDGANVLMLLGKSMEKLLIMPPSDFERYRKNNPGGVPESERNKPESYHYSIMGDFLLRSQLDAHDDRLPGTGMFDLKTRAVLPVRMQSQDHEPMTGYEITQAQGQFESFEREYYDMMRSTALKYSLQARMGLMDGIFVAYHNVKRIFGFQYISLNEMDMALHGTRNRALGNREFGLSISLLNEIFNKATEKFPDQSIRFHFETRPAEALPLMQIFAEPISEDDIDTIQDSQKEKIAAWERDLRKMSTDTKTEESEDSAEEVDPEDDEFEDSSSGLAMKAAPAAETQGESKASEPSTAKSERTSTQDSQASEEEDLAREIQDLSDTSPTEDELNKPLLGIVLTVRSKVDGEYVERPENLGRKHKWTIEYSMKEMSQKEACYTYKLTKNRRKRAYDKLRKANQLDPDSSAAIYNDQFIEMLKELSEKGSRKRDKLDRSARRKPTIVFGKPYDKSAEHTEEKMDDINIEGVDDYLRWLYGAKTSSAEEQ